MRPRHTAPAGTRVAASVVMKIAQLMSKDVKTCHPHDTLDTAVKLMWDHDIGSVTVVDDHGQLVGIVTDRDACMAAFTRGQRLDQLACSSAMTNHVVTCRPFEDSDTAVAKKMAKNKIRRIPVVDDAEVPIGMVSLNDLAIATPRALGRIPASEIKNTLAAICEHRTLA